MPDKDKEASIALASFLAITSVTESKYPAT
jgi:hypothetical protein